MTVWIPTESDCVFGVAIYNYSEEGEHRLHLNVGDTVHILRQNAGWFYGYNLRARQQRGIFPKSFIHIKEASIVRTGSFDTAVPKEPPLVQEITSILREWGAIWKNLYISSNRTELSDFERIWKKMRELIDWRRLIMSSKLTMDEMKELQQKVTNKIDMGNAILGLDLVVRDEHGNILEPTQTSSISLFRQAQNTYVNLWKSGIRDLAHGHLIQHQLATQRIQDEKDSVSEKAPPRKSTSFNIFVNVKNFVCRISEDSDVLITLYDVKQGTFISEHYLIKWGSQGMPRDIEMFNNLKVLYTDLGIKDASKEKISLVCQIIRIGRMDLKEADTKKQTHCIRRPFGVAAMDITPIIKGTLDPDEDKQYFVPFMQCNDRDSLESLVKKAIAVKEIQHKGMGLWITLKKIHGDLKQVQKEYPHLLTGTAIARKMGFPDVIMPGDVRNDIYVTLTLGEFKRGNKTSDKNIEVSMCVCNQHGEVLQNVISEGAGGDMVNTYRSVVYYHEDKPKWSETVKVAIPIDEFYGSHLKFSFKHRSSVDAKDRVERPFAMSYVKLMQENGVTISDTVHDLLVYKVDGKKYEEVSVYLQLPSKRSDLEIKGQPMMPLNKYQIQAGALTLNTSDSFQISTLVCSTKLTHNVDLMGLLKWRDNPAGLKDHLLAFMQVDGEEVVKFLQDTLDALFNILMQNHDSDLYDNLVFDALVFIIGLISDRKYGQFRPVLDLYIKENFSATLAYNKLMVVLKFYVENVHSEKHQESAFKAMKSLQYIFKFIIRSRILFAALNEGRGKQQFEISLKQVFNAINQLMRDTEEVTTGVQGAALKYLPSTIADVVTVFDPSEFSLILVEFVQSVPRDRLVHQKLVCISDIIHSPLFLVSESRHIMLEEMMNVVCSLLTRKEEKETCSEILSDVLELLYRKDIGPTRDDISTMSRGVLRTVIQTVISMDRHDSLIGNFVAVMTGILWQMNEPHYTQYLDHFATRIDLTDFLMEILMVFKDLVNNNVFPQDWHEMIMLQNSVFLKALRYFANTIQDKFTKPFEQQLWKNFFHCAISFLTQEHLQLENFSSAKRNKIISKYKDMRRETGFEIRSMWFNLGQHKSDFIPEIVGPILEMTLIPEIELRKATIPIFFDMMQCEFMSVPAGGTGRHYKGHFREFEDEMITKLDALVGGGRGDVQYMELFYSIMNSLCENHSTMKKEGLAFVEIVRELLQRLLEYRAVINEENRDNKMSCTVSLLNFYNEIQRKEMYIRYLHKLCDLHLECDNYTEAAHTLMLYAKLLEWSDDQLTPLLASEKYPNLTTHHQLKEQLYCTIIEYFDKGKMWEKGIELCKVLAHQYDSETFDYTRLSAILKKQAEFYDRIMNEMRPECGYFRVGYYGCGFPAFLQNKVFIYRGKEYERLSDFMSRLQNMFPNAHLLKSLTAPNEEIQKSDKEYLLINAVNPVLETKTKFCNKQVNEQIMKYYKVNEVQKFTFSKRSDEGKNDDVTKMWLERTTLTSSAPMPGILRWYQVKDVVTVIVSPLEHAIETLEMTNQKLKSLINQHRMEPNLRVDPLGMVLNGVVDAAVSGGIANYKTFYTEDYLIEHSDQRNLVKKLRQVTTKQMMLLQSAIDLHGLKAPESLQPLHAHIQQRFAQMLEMLEAEYGIKLGEDIKATVKRNQTMPSHRHSEFPMKRPESPIQRNAPLGRHTQSVMVKAASIISQTSRESSPTKAMKDSPTKIYTRVVNVSPRASFDNGSAEYATPSQLNADSASRSRKSSVTGSSNGSPKTSKKGLPRSGSAVIELSEQSEMEDVVSELGPPLSPTKLTPIRPLRPESDRRSKSFNKSLSLASRLSVTSTNSTTSTNSSSEALSAKPKSKLPTTKTKSTTTPNVEEPPPLPQKQMYADYSNLDPQEALQSVIRSNSVPGDSHRGKPQHPLPQESSESNGSVAPMIPPKKPLRGNSIDSTA